MMLQNSPQSPLIQQSGPQSWPQSGPQLPIAPGVGFKAQHFEYLENNNQPVHQPVQWLEIHAENYMGNGGRPIAQLRELSEKFAISVHGVALSIGSEGPLDKEHLDRLKHLIEWLNPASFSEHLAWSTHTDHFYNDLLPLPYTKTTLQSVCEHIDEVQTHIGRQMLLENPSSYLAFEQSTFSETDFLKEIISRTGCGLLLDVNNVFVSATNLDYTPHSYIDDYPLQSVGEIHLGGHHEDQDELGAPLLIDSHGTQVADPVWALLEYTLEKSGPRPLLIEWDNDVPQWEVLRQEAMRADNALKQASSKGLA